MSMIRVSPADDLHLPTVSCNQFLNEPVSYQYLCSLLFRERLA
jgi:hypothetical protein